MFRDPNWAASIWLFRKHVLSVVVTVFGGIMKALFIPRWIILFFSFPEPVCRLHYSTCTLLTLALISQFLQPADGKSHAVCYHLNGSFLLNFAHFFQPSDCKSWCSVLLSKCSTSPTSRLDVSCSVLAFKWVTFAHFSNPQIVSLMHCTNI
jgi:hypothetical protein